MINFEGKFEIIKFVIKLKIFDDILKYKVN